jgi:hypothetical protein
MMRARQQPVEGFAFRSYRQEAVASPPVSSASWMKGQRMQGRAFRSDPPICGLGWCGWNGDRTRGWAFYCGCGFCTPMRRSFSEGIDALEVHWMSRRSG